MTPPRLPVLVCASLALLAGFFPASAPAAPRKIYASAMQSRLQYRGFSVARPGVAGWFVDPKRQSHTDAMFQHDLPPEGTYSAFLSVALRSLPRAATSAADFAQLARQDKIVDTHRFTLLTYRQRPLQAQGQWAIEYDVTIRDTGAPIAGGQPLILHQSGRVIRHPTFPNSVVIINNSERGTRRELSPRVQAEGRSIAEGVRLESAPGQPVI